MSSEDNDGTIEELNNLNAGGEARIDQEIQDDPEPIRKYQNILSALRDLHQETYLHFKKRGKELGTKKISSIDGLKTHPHYIEAEAAFDKVNKEHSEEHRKWSERHSEFAAMKKARSNKKREIARKKTHEAKRLAKMEQSQQQALKSSSTESGSSKRASVLEVVREFNQKKCKILNEIQSLVSSSSEEFSYEFQKAMEAIL